MGFRVIQPASGQPTEEGGGRFRVIMPANPGKAKKGAVAYVTGLASAVNRGLGIGDELAAGFGTVADIASGKARPTRDARTGRVTPIDIAAVYRENMRRQRLTEDEFTASNPNAAALGRGTGMAAASIFPIGAGGVPSNALSATAQGATLGGLGAGTYSLADRGTLEERLTQANQNIPIGMATGGALGLFGFRLGERARRRAETDAETAGRLLARRASARPGQMADEAAAMREVGVAPTGLDVAGERGRRLVRATGVRTDTAGETLTDNAARISAGTKPAVMGSTRRLVNDPRTAAQYVDDLTTARSEAASTQYRQPYQTPVQIDADTAAALRGDPGRAAIQRARQAAIARQDYGQAQELDSLLAQNMEDFPTVSAGTLDRIRIAMGERAEVAGRRGARDIAAGLRGRQSAVTRALDNVEGLADARANFRATTQAIEAAGPDRLDLFSTDPADYARWMQSLGPEARQANAMAIRQEVLDTLGGQRSSTFGSLDELATSPYVRENLSAALGEDAADAYLRNIAARLRQTRNATMVTPGAGSRTAVLENDLGAAADDVFSGLTAVQQGSTGNLLGLARTAADWWRRRGVRPAEAEALARAVTDPNQLDDIIAAISRSQGDDAAQDFMRSLLQAANDAGPSDPAVAAITRRVADRLSRAAGVGSAAPMGREPAVEAYFPERPEFGVGRSY